MLLLHGGCSSEVRVPARRFRSPILQSIAHVFNGAISAADIFRLIPLNSRVPSQNRRRVGENIPLGATSRIVVINR